MGRRAKSNRRVGDAVSSVHDAIEKALTILVYCFLAALLATGAAYPPSAPVLYGPALLALLAGVGAYAGARGIPVPPPDVPK